MRHVLDRITAPERVTEDAMKAAVADNVDRLLKHEMSRHAFHRALTTVRDISALPVLHLMDQRARLPMPTLRSGTATNDIEANHKDLSQHLDRMLSISAHPGGRELIAQVLRCDPESDSRLIAHAYAAAPSFARAALRGRLGSATKLAAASSVNASSGIISQMAKYHGSLQLQLLAARGRAIDRLLFRLSPSPRAFSETEVCKELIQVLSAIEQILKKTSRETRQPPQSALVTDRRDAAVRTRSSMPGDDDEIVDSIVTFFQARRQELVDVTKALKLLQKETIGVSLHKALFGLTSVEALIFGATRLVQLRDLASELVESSTAMKAWIPIQKKKLPAIDDVDVATLVYVHRALILRDASAPPVVSDQGRNLDLKTAWEENASGVLPAANTTKKRGAFLFQPFMERQQMVSPFATRLADGQRLDLLPEFLFQKVARVKEVLPGSELLEQVKRGREQEHANRPRNIMRAPKRAARA